jgi:hypothetical protein
MSVWHELIVIGSEKALRGFIAGFEAGREVRDVVMLGEDIQVEGLPFAERLRGLVGGGTPHLVIAPERSGRALAAAIETRGADAGLELRAVRVVASAHFAFKAKAFAPDVAARIRTALLGSLPEGVTVEGLRQDERLEADARGTELYSPVHDYTWEATGTFAGPLPGVLEMHRRGRNLEFVEPGELHLEVKQESAP